MEEVEAQKQAWKFPVAACTQMQASVLKAGKAVTDYVKTSERMSEKKRKLDMARKEKEEKEAAKKQQAAAATALTSLDPGHAIFKAGLASAEQWKMQCITLPPSTEDLLNAPWIMAENGEVKRWSSHLSDPNRRDFESQIASDCNRNSKKSLRLRRHL